MSNISMVEAGLPPGFRFHPRDDELVCDYLMRKVSGADSLLLIEVDLNNCEPWDIPEVACVGGKEWYFYSQRDRKYATGLRTNRATASGYWKATGKDRPVVRRGTLVGMRKTLVFYLGRAPRGRKTEWVMHEFRIEGGPFPPPPPPPALKDDWVLCRLFHKSRDVGAAGVDFPTDYANQGLESFDHDTIPSFPDSSISHQPNTFDYRQVSCFSILSRNQSQCQAGPRFLGQPQSCNFTPTFASLFDNL
ncbi:hypothetical protein MLD38_035118 [Melastoma candidum]|uniref:Uncharacterized protein n=1 Tax=Melastoma candidum TaxID=119954 RepID=A0ACB9MC63_9MYRT|nr:hypothetical protein MLD38_035118 [Melastoma candidum]